MLLPVVALGLLLLLLFVVVLGVGVLAELGNLLLEVLPGKEKTISLSTVISSSAIGPIEIVIK